MQAFRKLPDNPFYALRLQWIESMLSGFVATTGPWKYAPFFKALGLKARSLQLLDAHHPDST